MASAAKRKRGRPFKNSAVSASQHPPEFFKIYLPEHNSKQLMIPPDFVNNFKGKIPKIVSLKNLQGKVWNVELEKTECKLLMKKGWEGFVIGNSLARGEFLVFTYKGKSEFIVKIFSINGCVKDDEPAANCDQPLVKVKQEPNSDQNYSHHTAACENTYLERSTKVELVSQADSHEVMTRGAPERTIKSERIRFTRVYEGKLYELHIPEGVFTDYNIKQPEINKPEMILLKYQIGISQIVRICRGHDRVLVTSGWREFQLKNKMFKGDECDFEITLSEGRKIKEIELLQIRPQKTVTSKSEMTMRPRKQVSG